METTDYCSYELSKALKNAGFDEPCDHYCYRPYTNSDEMEMRQGKTMDYNNDDWYVPHCSAPTLWHAQKWLREKGVEVVVEPRFSNYKHIGYDWMCHDDCSGDYAMRAPLPFSDTYECALSAGISAALELIKKEE